VKKDGGFLYLLDFCICWPEAESCKNKAIAITHDSCGSETVFDKKEHKSRQVSKHDYPIKHLSPLQSFS